MSLTTQLVLPSGILGIGMALSYLSTRLISDPDIFRLARAEQPLAHELPYWFFVGDGGCGVAVHVDLTYASLFELNGIDVDCADDDSLNHLAMQLHSTIQHLPPRVRLQFLHWTDRDISSQVAGYRSAVDPDRHTDGIGAKLVHEKAQQLLRDPSLRRSCLYLALSMTPEGGGMPLFASVRARHRSMAAGEHAERLRQLQNIREQIRSGLQSADLSVRSVPFSEYRRLIYQFLNPDRAELVPDPFVDETGVANDHPLGWSEDQSAREQLSLSSIREEPRSLVLGDKRMRVLTLKALPTVTSPALLESLLVGLPFHCRIAFAVEVLDSGKALDDLKQKRDQAHALATLKERRNQEAEAQERDVLELIDKNLQANVRMTRVSLSVLLVVDDHLRDAEAVLDQQSAHVVRTLSGLYGAQMMVDELCQLPEFLAMLPGNAGSGRRWRRCTSENASHLLPIWQPYRGSARPLVLVQNGRGNLVGIDPFDSRLDNPNAFMAGSTGSGKSATTNFLLLNALASGARALIVDVGGSYRRVIDYFGGQYFAIGLDQHRCTLNPFFAPSEIVQPGGRLDETRLQFIMAVIERMVCDEIRRQLTNPERAVLGHAVGLTYEGSGSTTPILADLQAVLGRYPSSDAEDVALAADLARQLRVWVEGPAARLVNGRSTVALTADCAAFDLKGLEGQRDLQAVVMLILSGIIWNLVMRDRAERKMVVFDEVWKLLSSPSSARLIEELYRTSRKYRASILTISQSVEDFTTSSIASALVNNSATVYLLRHRHGHAAIAKQFRLNAREEYIFERLEMRRGEYTEALILHGESHFLGRIVLSPLEYWMATTDPADLALEHQLADAHPEWSSIELLSHLADQYPQGAARARGDQ